MAVSPPRYCALCAPHAKGSYVGAASQTSPCAPDRPCSPPAKCSSPSCPWPRWWLGPPWWCTAAWPGGRRAAPRAAACHPVSAWWPPRRCLAALQARCGPTVCPPLCLAATLQPHFSFQPAILPTPTIRPLPNPNNPARGDHSQPGGHCCINQGRRRPRPRQPRAAPGGRPAGVCCAGLGWGWDRDGGLGVGWPPALCKPGPSHAVPASSCRQAAAQSAAHAASAC